MYKVKTNKGIYCYAYFLDTAIWVCTMLVDTKSLNLYPRIVDLATDEIVRTFYPIKNG